ncbi:MAG TPA: hypothetical protein VF311_01595 [Terriglobales bacterium]|jgi:aspartate ammonia-lyase
MLLRAGNGYACNRSEPLHWPRKAAEIAKEAVATGKSIIEIARAKKLLSDQQIKEILDPARMREPVRPLEAAKDREKLKAK